MSDNEQHRNPALNVAAVTDAVAEGNTIALGTLVQVVRGLQDVESTPITGLVVGVLETSTCKRLTLQTLTGTVRVCSDQCQRYRDDRLAKALDRLFERDNQPAK